MDIIVITGLTLALLYLIKKFFAEASAFFGCVPDAEETGAPNGEDCPDVYACTREEIEVTSCKVHRRQAR